MVDHASLIIFVKYADVLKLDKTIFIWNERALLRMCNIQTHMN